MQPYPLAQRCGRPSQLTECNTSSLVSHGNSGTSQQVSLLLCNRPVRECAPPGSPPLLCCCAPRCDLGERAGSRARGPGVHRRGSVRTKAKAASISHLTSCAQKTATVLRENVTSFLFKYSIDAFIYKTHSYNAALAYTASFEANCSSREVQNLALTLHALSRAGALGGGLRAAALRLARPRLGTAD